MHDLMHLFYAYMGVHISKTHSHSPVCMHLWSSQNVERVYTFSTYLRDMKKYTGNNGSKERYIELDQCPIIYLIPKWKGLAFVWKITCSSMGGQVFLRWVSAVSFSWETRSCQRLSLCCVRPHCRIILKSALLDINLLHSCSCAVLTSLSPAISQCASSISFITANLFLQQSSRNWENWIIGFVKLVNLMAKFQSRVCDRRIFQDTFSESRARTNFPMLPWTKFYF